MRPGFTGTKRLASGRWAAFRDGRLLGRVVETFDEADRLLNPETPQERVNREDYERRVARNALRPPERQCRGGVCIDILQQCSRHSWEYQERWGRAANE